MLPDLFVTHFSPTLECSETVAITSGFAAHASLLLLLGSSKRRHCASPLNKKSCLSPSHFQSWLKGMKNGPSQKIHHERELTSINSLCNQERFIGVDVLSALLWRLMEKKTQQWLMACHVMRVAYVFFSSLALNMQSAKSVKKNHNLLINKQTNK